MSARRPHATPTSPSAPTAPTSCSPASLPRSFPSFAGNGPCPPPTGSSVAISVSSETCLASSPGVRRILRRCSDGGGDGTGGGGGGDWKVSGGAHGVRGRGSRCVHHSRCLRLKAANGTRCKGSDYGGMATMVAVVAVVAMVVLVVVVVVRGGKDSCSAAASLSIAALVVPVGGSFASIAIETDIRRRRRRG